MNASPTPIRYAIVLRREDSRSDLINASDADFYSIVHWGTELKAKGKIVSGALVEAAREAAVPDGFLILSVEGAAEADDIARSWPVRDGVKVDLVRVTGNF
jgi:hypothetical protein